MLGKRASLIEKALIKQAEKQAAQNLIDFFTKCAGDPAPTELAPYALAGLLGNMGVGGLVGGMPRAMRYGGMTAGAGIGAGLGGMTAMLAQGRQTNPWLTALGYGAGSLGGGYLGHQLGGMLGGPEKEQKKKELPG